MGGQMFKRLAFVSAVALVFAGSPAFAQNAIEIGVDNALAIQLIQEFKVGDVVVDSSRTDISFDLPFSFWRFGFFVNENISIEPAIGVSFVSFGNDGGSLTLFNGGVDILYNMPSNVFVHGGGALVLARASSDGESDTASQFGFGGGAGYRVPLISESIMVRLGVRGIYLLKSEDDGLPASINILGTFGISVMTN
jgi:hypothetical protein